MERLGEERLGKMAGYLHGQLPTRRVGGGYAYDADASDNLHTDALLASQNTYRALGRDVAAARGPMSPYDVEVVAEILGGAEELAHREANRTGTPVEVRFGCANTLLLQVLSREP